VKKLTKKQKERVLCALSGKKYKYANGTLHKIQGTEHAYCALGAIGKEFTGKDIEGGILDIDNTGSDWKKIPAALRNDDIQDEILSRNDASTTKSYKEARQWIIKNL
jgi:hypothetical protein